MAQKHQLQLHDYNCLENYFAAKLQLQLHGLFLCELFYIIIRRRTNVQQLTCNIDLSSYFYYFFFSFVLIELKPFVEGKSPGGKF